MLGRDRRFALLGFMLATTAFATAGCGAQADTSYRGAPLAELHGTIQTDASGALTSAPPPLAAALVWDGLPPGADRKASVARPEVGTSVPVSGQFPAQFTLQLFTPPADAALFSCFADKTRPGRIAQGSVRAIRQGTSPAKLTITDLYGTVDHFLIIYVDADLPAVSDCPVGALGKGYHLFESTPTPDKPGCVRAAPDDPSCNGPWPFTEVPLSTALTLRLWHEDGMATPPPAPSPPPAGTP